MLESTQAYRWRPPSPIDPKGILDLEGIHPKMVEVLWSRGIRDRRAVEGLLGGMDDDAEDEIGRPRSFQLADIELAVERISEAIIRDERIAVYGDYDADGVTSTALLSRLIQRLGGDVKTRIPHRERDGYGLRPHLVSDLIAEGTGLIITVDCGVRANDEIEHAKQAGVDVIVTDHHVLPEVLPSAFALINPRRPDCSFGFQDLAGVGLAYHLATALYWHFGQAYPERLGAATASEFQNEVRALTAIGTVADVVPLVDENRRLVRRGIKAMAPSSPGLSALLRQAKVDPSRLSARDIGFSIAPRINAAGRMAHADLALGLLCAESVENGLSLAGELDALNAQRKLATQAALERAESSLDRGDPDLVFVVDPDLPLGVVGLVAGRLAERHYRPALVMNVKDGIARGSARSIPEYDVIDAISASGELLERFGGHARAAGFSLKAERLEAFKQALEAHARLRLSEMPRKPIVEFAAELGVEDLSWDLLESIRRFEPYGEGFPEPVFLLRDAEVINSRTVGSDGAHLKLRFAAAELSPPYIDAIAFGRGDAAMGLPNRLDLACTLMENRWRDRVSLELRILDFTAAGEARIEASSDEAKASY